METKLSETLMDKITRYAPALFERAESEERKKIQAERKAKAGELARVEQETQERVEMLLDEQKKAEALVKQAEAALSEKKEALVSVKSSLWSARSRGETRRQNCVNTCWKRQARRLMRQSNFSMIS